VLADSGKQRHRAYWNAQVKAQVRANFVNNLSVDSLAKANTRASHNGRRVLGQKLWFSAMCITVLVALGAIAIGVWQSSRSGGFFPLTQLVIESHFHHVSAEQIRAAARAELQSNFFNVDLTAVRAKIAGEAWIEQVEVRKRWPDTIIVRVLERTAVAHWNDDALMDARATAFQVARAEDIRGLVRLAGPETRRVELLAFYQQSEPSLRQLSLHMTHAQITERGALTVKLSDGSKIMLGRDQQRERWRRLIENLPTLRSKNVGSRLVEVDMRYTNGLAVRFQSLAPVTAPAPAPAPEAPATAPTGPAVLAGSVSNLFSLSDKTTGTLLGAIQ
jgi:cell division protein FtsQ